MSPQAGDNFDFLMRRDCPRLLSGDYSGVFHALPDFVQQLLFSCEDVLIKYWRLTRALSAEYVFEYSQIPSSEGCPGQES